MKQQKKQADITIFYSYASADSTWRDQFSVHLSQLKRDGLIEEWYDQQNSRWLGPPSDHRSGYPLCSDHSPAHQCRFSGI